MVIKVIYITGDKHGDFIDVFYFCLNNKTTLNDTLIVLGDAGINYYANEKDYICISDIAKTKSNNSRAADVIRNWLRNRSTLDFLTT